MAMRASTESGNCPACGIALGPVFYETGPVPVHSCLMLDSAEAAIGFPTGNVRLAPCTDCGFVTNVGFDSKWSAYSPDYEDQQSFSPTFNSFAGRLARDLVHRHGLEGKRAVEIGCSKGDFLALLCEAGGMETIGIDPSVLPGRVAQPTRGSMKLIAEYYDDAHTRLPADLICHRHTLEHIHDIRGHLDLLYRHAAANPAAVVFIEVPCARRVFEENAFEDIYYEHASYFTPGSLARALRLAGFGVLRLWRDYQNQYLLAEVSADQTLDRTFEIEESTDATLDLIARFGIEVRQVIDAWHFRMKRLHASGQKIAIWGSGSKCISFLHATNGIGCIDVIFDINPHRKSRYIPGVPMAVSHADDVGRVRPDHIVIMNAAYREEIAAEVASAGVGAAFSELGGEQQSAVSEKVVEHIG